MSQPEFSTLLASGIDLQSSNPIREMLSQTVKPDTILFSGGYPAPESFPVETIQILADKVSRKGSEVLQYQKTEGYQPLLEVLPSFLIRNNRHINTTPENIAITAGSQQMIDILGRIFLNPGDKIAVESPTYVGALQAFNYYQPEYIEIASDKDGVIPDSLEQAFKDHPEIKLFYFIPSYQNPTGKTNPFARRMKVADILMRYEKLAAEDDPYSEITYDDQQPPSLQSLAPENVFHLFTFSKTFAPGFRIGGVVGPKDFIEIVNKQKQGMVLHTSGFDQAMVAEYLRGGYLEKHIPNIISIYQPRRDTMVNAISEFFPDVFDFTVPQGGLFIWVSLKESAKELSDLFNIQTLFAEAKQAGVCFVPGSAFFANKTIEHVAMRLNFSNQPEEKIIKGIKILGDIMTSKLR